MKDFHIERWAACVMPGAVMIVAVCLPLSFVFRIDWELGEIGAGPAVLLASGLFLLSYVVGVALWGLAYQDRVNRIITSGSRQKHRVVAADGYVRRRLGLDAPREDGKWLEEIAAIVLPKFTYRTGLQPEDCYTVFENAMTAAYLHEDSQLLSRIVWEREIVGMLQCSILSFYALAASLTGVAVCKACLGESLIAVGLGLLAVCTAGLAASLVLHLKLRNRLLARDVVVAAMSKKPNVEDGRQG